MPCSVTVPGSPLLAETLGVSHMAGSQVQGGAVMSRHV